MPNRDRPLPRAASLMTARSFTSCQPSRNDDTGRPLLGLLVDHDGHAGAAVGVAAAVDLAPVGTRYRAPDPPSRAKVVIIEIGNQSRSGSPMPVCRLMSWARSAIV